MPREVPLDFDLTPPVGCELLSVLIASNHAELNFLRSPHVIDGRTREDGCRIDVEAGFVLRGPGEETIACDNATLRDGVASLVSLIGQAVDSFDWESDGALTLVFANGNRLTFRVDGQGFDSYHVHTANSSVTI
jgi:hypothetical protein